MKKFTDTQKKWALTATMIAALGLNVSFNPLNSTSFETMDFASTSQSFELDGKDITVKYVSEGKNKTKAQVSGLTDCGNCFREYIIDKKLAKDAQTLTDIQVALVAEIARDTNSEETASDEDVEERDERSEREERLSESRKERQERAAEKKKRSSQAKEDYKKIRKLMELVDCEDEVDQAQCLTDEYLSVIDRDKPFAEKAVYQYFADKIEPQILDLLLDSSPSNERNIYSVNKATLAIKTLKQFMKEIPSDYASLRERVVFLASQSIHASASLQRDYLNRFATTGNPEAKTAAIAQDMWTQQLVDNLQHVVSPVAIRSGLANGTISMRDAEAIYQNNYALYANSIRAGTQLWTVKGQPVNLGAYALPELQYANVVGLEGIQSDVYRGVPAPDLTTRLMSDQRGGQVIIQTVPANSQHLQFGTPQPISPTTQQQLLELRASQQYHRAQ